MVNRPPARVTVLLKPTALFIRSILGHLYLSLFCSVIFGIEVSQIEGQLLDDSTGAPVVGADILVFQEGDTLAMMGTATDDQGRFILTGLSETGIDMLIRHIAYRPVKMENISTTEVSVDLGVILLEKTSLEMPEIISTAEAPAISYKVGKIVIDVEDANVSESESAAELLTNVPSVTINEENSAEIRGDKAAIYIDGVKTDAEDILSQLPAGSIKSIEVIPNPLAKYEADVGGVIDIKLKKHARKGINGRVRLGVHSSGDYLAAINTSLSTGALSTFGEYSQRHHSRTSTTEYNRETFSESPWFLDQNAQMNRDQFNGRVRLGSKWQLSDQNAVKLSYSFNSNDKQQDSHTRSDRLDGSLQLQRFMLRDRYIRDNRARNEFKATFNHDPDESKAAVQILYSRSISEADHTQDNLKQTLKFEGDQFPVSTLDSLLIDDHRDNEMIKIDISLPLSDQQAIDLGYQFRHEDNHLINRYFTPSFSQNEWLIDSSRGGPFHFSENTHGSYFMYTFAINGYGSNVGTRVEFIQNESFNTDSTTLSNEYFQFLPSLQVSRRITPFKSLQATYSRRVVPPAFARLNPQVNNTSSYFLRTGNPYLEPEQIDSFELQYIYQTEKHTLSSALFHKRIEGIIGNKIEIIADTISHSFPDNLSSGRSLGGEINWVYKPSSSTRISTNIVLFHSKLIPENLALSDSREYSSTRAKLKFDKNWNKRIYLQLVHNYESPRITWQGRTLTRQHTDVSLKAYLWDRSVIVSMKGLDVLDALRTEKEITYRSDFDAYQLTAYDSRRLVGALTYNFNNRRKP